jgi:hypothetical protein
MQEQPKALLLRPRLFQGLSLACSTIGKPLGYPTPNDVNAQELATEKISQLTATLLPCESLRGYLGRVAGTQSDLT